MKVNGSLVLTQGIVNQAEIPQGGCFSTAIADFTLDFQRLVMKVNGSLVLTQGKVSIAEIPQGVCFSLAIA